MRNFAILLIAAAFSLTANASDFNKRETSPVLKECIDHVNDMKKRIESIRASASLKERFENLVYLSSDYVATGGKCCSAYKSVTNEAADKEISDAMGIYSTVAIDAINTMKSEIFKSSALLKVTLISSLQMMNPARSYFESCIERKLEGQ
ncbi:unnamed protein product [Mucor hiemalis]